MSASTVGRTVLVIASVVGFVAAASWVLVQPSAPHKHVEVALVFDPSLSIDDPCHGTEEIGRGLIALAAGRPLTVHPVYMTDKKVDGLGQMVADIKLERSVTGFEGEEDRRRRAASFLSKLVKTCADAPRRKWSPVLGAVDVGLKDLRTHGCGQPGATCLLVVKSDGLENVDRALVARLAGKKISAGPRLQVDELDRVIFCDLGRRAPGGRNVPALDATMGAWRSELTTDARAVLAPACNEDLFNQPVRTAAARLK